MGTPVQKLSTQKMSKRHGSTRKESVSPLAPAAAPSLHRCSFFPYQPAAISHVVATPAGCLPQVAVIRGTEPSTIEIFTPSSDWAVERVIYGRAGENFECAAFVGPSVDEAASSDSEDSSEDEVDISSAIAKNVALEATKFVRDTSKLNAKHFLPLAESDKMARARFFSAGVDGRLREWSNGPGNQSIEIFSIDVNGGAIWSLAVSPDQKILAVGCEDGRIRLFSIYDRSVEFLRGFEAVEGTFTDSAVSSSSRILSLAWNSRGNVLISGSASGALKLWNCSTGRPVHSLKLANSSIWSVAFCSENDATFVTGDSKGQVQFWDSQSGTLLQNFPVFGADVLSLTLASGKVFATGVDHKIVEFVQVIAPNAVGHTATKWIQGGKRYFHTHDVRSITALSIKYQKDAEFLERTVIVSGGVDCTLVISEPESFDRALEQNSKTFSSQHRRLLPFSRQVSMIQMARDTPVLAGKIGNTIQIWKIDPFVHVADLKISRHESIVSFTISPSGNFVCILTSSEVKLFRLDGSNIHKIENIPALKMAKKAAFPHLVSFLNESTLLLLNSQEILNLKLDSEAAITVSQADSFNLSFNPRRISVNHSGERIALSTDRQVYVISFGKKRSIDKVLESSHAITCVSFLKDDALAISDCRNSVVRVSPDGKSTIDSFEFLPKEWKIRKEPIMGIHSHPTVPNKISCWSDASILQLTFPEASAKRKSAGISADSMDFKLIDDYRPLLFFSHLPGGADSVVIERPWSAIIENFPPAFYRTRYGAQ